MMFLDCMEPEYKENDTVEHLDPAIVLDPGRCFWNHNSDNGLRPHSLCQVITS